MTQNIQKSFKPKISPFKFGSTYEFIKNGCCLLKHFLTKMFQINSRKSQKISKKFDKKQEKWQTKD